MVIWAGNLKKRSGQKNFDQFCLSKKKDKVEEKLHQIELSTTFRFHDMAI